MKNKFTILISLFLIVFATSSSAGFLDDAWEKTKRTASKTAKAAGKVVKGAAKATEATVRAGREAVTGGSASTEFKDAKRHGKDTIKGTYDATTGVAKTVGYGIVAVADGTVNVLNEGGEEFSELICDIVGKEPGKDCHVSGGAEMNSEGEITATDGQGTPSEKPEPTFNDKETDQLAWLKAIELQDWEQATKNERYIVGGFLMLAPFLPPNITWFNNLPSSPTRTGKIRTAYGNQALVGTRRIDGNIARLHRGTDYTTQPDQPILASFDGEVVAVGRMTNKPFNYVHIKNKNGIIQRNFYVSASVSKGDKVKRGSVIGTAENLHVDNGYPSSVSNHVHVEYRSPEGHSLSPDGKYLVAKDQGNAAAICRNNKCFAPSSN